MTSVFCAGSAAMVASLASTSDGEPSAELFEATTIACALAGRSLSTVDISRVADVFNSVSRRLASFTSRWDVLVTPVAITPPTNLGTYDSNDASLTAGEYVQKILTPHPTCMFYNVSGAPAISLPTAVSGTGLPIGVQFGANDFREDVLIQLAGQIEEAVQWQTRSPRQHVSSLAAS
jgi:amidase